MFTKREKRMISNRYFTVIREDEQFVEVRSNNTRHQWIIFKKAYDLNKPVVLYHKHTADTKYYHKHWETWTVEEAIESIKNHDAYVMENGEIIRWEKQKGRINYGRI